MEKGQQYVEWWTKKAIFTFNDVENFESWKNDPKMFFEFSPSNSADNAAAILKKPMSEHVMIELTTENSAVEMLNEDMQICMSASIFFLLNNHNDDIGIDFSDSLDAKTLRHWSNDLDGDNCGNFDLCDPVADMVEDSGSGWRIVTVGEDGEVIDDWARK